MKRMGFSHNLSRHHLLAGDELRVENSKWSIFSILIIPRRYETLTDVDIFEKIIAQETIDLLVEQSHSYPKISSDQMKCEIAIMILNGYHEFPGKDMPGIET